MCVWLCVCVSECWNSSDTTWRILRGRILLLFSRWVVSNSLQPHGLQHARLPCPSLSPTVCSNSCPLNRWCHPTISSCHPLLFPPSIFPSIRVFSIEASIRELFHVLLRQPIPLQLLGYKTAHIHSHHILRCTVSCRNPSMFLIPPCFKAPSIVFLHRCSFPLLLFFSPLRFFFFFLIFVGVWLLYNVILVSAVQQSESVICIHIHSCMHAQLPQLCPTLLRPHRW